MHNTILILALGLLRLSNAMSTVTVSVNTGDCPATYSSNSTDSWPYPTATSSSATASTTSLIYPETPCPASPGSSYMDLAGVEYNVYCNTGMIGSDLGAVNASSFDECLGICDVYLPPDAVSPACEAVTFTTTYVATGNCQLKFDIKDVILLTYPAHSAEIAQVDSTPDDGASISSVLATASASTSASVSQSVAGSSTSSPAPVVTPTPAEPCPCPALDNQTISDSQTLSWHLQCDATFTTYDEATAQNVATLDACMMLCDYYVDNIGPCQGIAYIPGGSFTGKNCYLSYSSDPMAVRTSPGAACIGTASKI